jgi:putative endonuclease
MLEFAGGKKSDAKRQLVHAVLVVTKLGKRRQRWFVYVLRSNNGSRTYVGVALSVERRLEQHNGGKPGGAKSTRGHRPWSVAVVHGPFWSRAMAQRIEFTVKQKRGPQRMVALLDLEQRAATNRQRRIESIRVANAKRKIS